MLKAAVQRGKLRWSQGQKGLSWGVDWADREAVRLFCFICMLSSLTSSRSYDLLSLLVWDLLCYFSHPAVFSSTPPPPWKAILKDHWKKKDHSKNRGIITQGQGEITRWRPNSRNVSNLFFFLWVRCRPSWMPSGVLAGVGFSREVFHLSWGWRFSPHPLLTASLPAPAGMCDLGAAAGQNTSGKHKWNVFLSKCPPPSQNNSVFKRASQTPPAVYKRSCISLLVMHDGRSENRDLLFLWWIEFDAWIMVTNVIENVAFPLYGFIEHRDDNPLPSDW